MIKFIIAFLVVLFSGLLLFPGNDIVELRYPSYYDIPSNTGINTWLPVFFPKESINIEFYSNLDTNYFYVKFNLDPGYSDYFESQLSAKASGKGIEYLNKIINVDNSWCKVDSAKMNKEVGNLYLIGKSGGDKYIMTGAFSINGRNDSRYRTYCIF